MQFSRQLCFLQNLAEIFPALKVKVEEVVHGGFLDSEIGEKIEGPPGARCGDALTSLIPCVTLFMFYSCVFGLKCKCHLGIKKETSRKEVLNPSVPRDV